MEKCKTILLISLIFLSMLLTYRLWFAEVPLEEETLPRYEDAYFTPPPSLQEVVKPEKILFISEETQLLRRGENEHGRLWDTWLKLMQENLPIIEEIARENKDLWEQALRDNPYKLMMRFSPSFPFECLSKDMEAVLLPLEVEEVLLAWDEEDDRMAELFLREGGETFHTTIKLQTEQARQLNPRTRYSYKSFIPGTDTILAANDSDSNEEANEEIREKNIEFIVKDPADEEEKNGEDEDKEEREEEIEDNAEESKEDEEIEDDKTEGESENGDVEEDGGVEEEDIDGEDEKADVNGEEDINEENDEVEEYQQQWNIHIPDELYIPVEEVKASKRGLKREELPQDELVRAFFLDPSMSSRIEERDGAHYFTDGERGVRIYPQGWLEYTAPALERGAAQITYHNALLRGVENKSLFGGWLDESYLSSVERDQDGFVFKWSLIKDGMPLEEIENESEMFLNERGVYYYRRNLFYFQEARGQEYAFRPFDEALYAALEKTEEDISQDEFALKSLEQVYFFCAENDDTTAVPAWKIEFEETGEMYLHWHTLEVLD